METEGFLKRLGRGVSLLFLLVLPSGSALRPGAAGPTRPFGPGEVLTYAIRYGVLVAGQATLAVEEGSAVGSRPTWKITATARSSGWLDPFYRVRDLNESLIDAEGFHSLRFHQNLREGAYRAERTLEFDYTAGKFTRVEKRKGKESRSEGPLPGFVQDVFSSLYYSRTLPLTEGAVHEFPSHSDGKNWTLKLTVLGRETIRTEAGEFSCLVVEPTLLSTGIFKHKGRLQVWLTDDPRHVPVFVRSKVTIGAVEVELMSAEGLAPLPESAHFDIPIQATQDVGRPPDTSIEDTP